MRVLLLFACAIAAAHAQPVAQGTTPSQAPAPTTLNKAGIIVLVDGQAQLAPGGKAPRQAKVGDVVHEGDQITSTDGEVHVNMEDAGFLVIRPHSKLEVVAYRADGSDDDKSVLHLVSGALRSITGWMGRYNARNYAIRAASITIGIRGTDHEIRYIPEGSAEGEPGVYDRVYAGETYIETPEGRTTVAPNQAGFQPLRTRGRPRLLAEIPGFFRRGPHEAEIEKKHAEIQKIIDQRREERRKAIAEKRAELQSARGRTVETARENRAAAKEEAQAARGERQEAQAKRAALQQQMKDAQALHEDIQQSRKSLDEAVKTGQITRPELRERRKELREKEARLKAMADDIKQKRKELEESSDARIDERFEAAQQRQKALHDQQLEAREKRKALEQERESAAKEIGSMQREENKRYREELKADRKGAAPSEGDSNAPKQ